VQLDVDKLQVKQLLVHISQELAEEF